MQLREPSSRGSLRWSKCDLSGVGYSARRPREASETEISEGRTMTVFVSEPGLRKSAEAAT